MKKSVKPVFVIFPEIYVLVKEHMADDRFDEQQKLRMAAISANWEAALSDHGDPVDKVEMYWEPPDDDDLEDSGYSFNAITINPDAEIDLRVASGHSLWR